MKTKQIAIIAIAAAVLAGAAVANPAGIPEHRAGSLEPASPPQADAAARQPEAASPAVSTPIEEKLQFWAVDLATRSQA